MSILFLCYGIGVVHIIDRVMVFPDDVPVTATSGSQSYLIATSGSQSHLNVISGSQSY